MRDKILSEVYSDDLYRQYAAEFYPQLVDEICSELFLILCEMDEDKLIALYNNNELKYYNIVIIKNMIFYKYSSFNKMYKQDKLDDSVVMENFDKVESEDDDSRDFNDDAADELVKDIKSFLKSRSKTTCGGWYDEEIFNMYFFSDKTYRDLSEETKIPTPSIFNTAKKTQAIVVKEFKKRYDDRVKSN